MKATHDWHRTTLGRAVLFLGGIRFAVPVLILVAIALAWGTYLESVHDSRVSRATVYGSWWFITLMAMIALSLIFAVITRFPWRRKHVGFITVHTGLVLLIVAGFWSMFGRLEGHLVLEEGQTSNILETDQEILELAEFNGGQSTILGVVDAPTRPGTVRVGGIELVVSEYWDNSREESFVADGGPQVLRAVEVSLDRGATAGEWIADEAKAGGPAAMGGVTFRVLADGETWEPPSGDAEGPAYYFTFEGQRFPLGSPGDQAFPGWTIVSVERFTHALVSSGKISESGGGEPNPAVDVTISDGQGSVERHTCFQNFPDMVMSRSLEGSARSGARLGARTATLKGEQLVVFGPLGSMRLGYVGPDGVGRELPGPFTAPVVVEVGGRAIKLINEYGRAHVSRRSVEAPKSSERRPALMVRLPGKSEPEVIAYKSMTPVLGAGKNLLLRYGPRVEELPFTVTLKDFRKLDYPGTAMAMKYESDVVVTRDGHEPHEYLVHMNTPYEHHPWKVYQSGFMGEQISIFSVMRDPGLPLTYLASTILCVGIFLTFFSRSLSWGHPGVVSGDPGKRKQSHVALEPDAVGDRAGRPEPELVGASG